MSVQRAGSAAQISSREGSTAPPIPVRRGDSSYVVPRSASRDPPNIREGSRVGDSPSNSIRAASGRAPSHRPSFSSPSKTVKVPVERPAAINSPCNSDFGSVQQSIVVQSLPSSQPPASSKLSKQTEPLSMPAEPLQQGKRPSPPRRPQSPSSSQRRGSETCISESLHSIPRAAMSTTTSVVRPRQIAEPSPSTNLATRALNSVISSPAGDVNAPHMRPGPARAVGQQRDEIQSSRAQPKAMQAASIPSEAVPPVRATNSKVDSEAALTGGFSSQRKVSSVPDSPSSPAAGRRSIVSNPHTFALASNTDVPIAHRGSHLPSEFAALCRFQQEHSNAANSASVSAGNGIAAMISDTSLHSVDGSVASVRAAAHSEIALNSVKAPLLSTASQPAPPPLIQAIRVQESYTPDNSQHEWIDTPSYSSSYAVPSRRWSLLEQHDSERLEAINASSGKTAAHAEAHQPFPTLSSHTIRIGDASQILVKERQHAAPLAQVADERDALVTCVVQIVSSEEHFTAAELHRDVFDPIAQSRITRCDLKKVTVGRLIDLIHRTLNFSPIRRGVVRAFSHENPANLVLSGSSKASVPQQCVTLYPEECPLEMFINMKAFDYFHKSEDRIVKLRWVEDGIPPSRIVCSANASSIASSPVSPAQRRNEVRRGEVVDGGCAELTTAESQTLRSLFGVTENDERTPVILRAYRAVPENSTTGDSATTQGIAAIQRPLVVGTTAAATAPAATQRTPSVPQVFVVPSRSASAKSQLAEVVESAPPIVEIRPIANATRNAEPYQVLREHVLGAKDGVERFGPSAVSGAVVEASRKMSPRPLPHYFDPRPRSSSSTLVDVATDDLEPVVPKVQDTVQDTMPAETIQEPANEREGRGTPIVIDGVRFVARSPKSKKIADEIAAIRAALGISD